MGQNPLPPSALTYTNHGTMQRANMDLPGKLARLAQEKSVAAQPGNAPSAMQINGSDWGESSNRNQYTGGEEEQRQKEKEEDQVVKAEEKDGFKPLKREQLLAASSKVPDVHLLFQSLKASGRKLIHFFIPFVESHEL